MVHKIEDGKEAGLSVSEQLNAKLSLVFGKRLSFIFFRRIMVDQNLHFTPFNN